VQQRRADDDDEPRAVDGHVTALLGSEGAASAALAVLRRRQAAEQPAGAEDRAARVRAVLSACYNPRAMVSRVGELRSGILQLNRAAR
jgi:hypothetical protein